MIKKTFVLSYPHEVVQQPITYHLVKDYDWIVSILRARITPNDSADEKGMLVLGVQGTRQNIDSGLDYLTRVGVHYEPLTQDVVWDEHRCIHCTACASLCPTGALYVTRSDMKVSFDKEKCIACEFCLTVCSYKAVSIKL